MHTTLVSLWEIQYQDTLFSVRIQWNCRRFSYLATTINAAKFTTRGQDNDD